MRVRRGAGGELENAGGAGQPVAGREARQADRVAQASDPRPQRAVLLEQLLLLAASPGPARSGRGSGRRGARRARGRRAGRPRAAREARRARACRCCAAARSRGPPDRRAPARDGGCAAAPASRRRGPSRRGAGARRSRGLGDALGGAQAGRAGPRVRRGSRPDPVAAAGASARAGSGTRPQTQTGMRGGQVQPRSASRKRCLTQRSSSEW